MLRYLCQSYLKLFNILTAAIGCVLLILSLNLLLNRDYRQQADVAEGYLKVYSAVILIIGTAVLAWSICVCSGISYENGYILCISAIIYFLFGIIILFNGVSLSIVLRSMKDYSDDALRGSTTNHKNEMKRYLNDFELGMYDNCCVLGLPDRPKCGDNDVVTRLEQFVIPFCYYDEDIYEAGRNIYENKNRDICKDFVRQEFCKAPSTTFAEFSRSLSDYFNESFYFLSIMLIILGVLLFFAFIGSTYVACLGENRRKRIFEVDDGYTRLEERHSEHEA